MSFIRPNPVAAIVEEGGIDSAADWLARTSYADTLLAENFDYANITAARSTASSSPYWGDSGTGDVSLIDEHALSGRTIRQAWTASVTSNPNTWILMLSGRRDTTAEIPRVYTQFIIWADELFNVVYNDGSGVGGTAKIAIIDRHDGSSNTGEVVLVNSWGLGFITAYHHTGSETGHEFMRSRSLVDFSGVAQLINAIDAGTPTTPATPAQFRARWGTAQPSGITPRPSLGGGSVASQGHPDSNTLLSGAVTWNRGGWTVIEVLMDKPNDICKIWGAHYGDEPTLLMDGSLDDTLSGSMSYGSRTGWTGIQITPYVTNHTAQAGLSASSHYQDVVEVTTRTEGFIPFPGGFGDPDGSDLAQLAASMSSGDWSSFTMGNLTDALLTAVGGTPTICTFAAGMLWDPTNKKIAFTGCAHTGGSDVSGAAGTILWDDATNGWTRDTYSGNSDTFGHAYSHTAMHPTTGDMYRRYFNSAVVRKKAYGTTGAASWETGHVTNISGDYANQVSGALVWFNELNSGSGGLVFVDTLGANWSNAALSSWSAQSGDSTSGNYDNVAVRAGGFVYFGGGQGNTNMFRMNSSGTVSSQTAFPLSPGYNSTGQGILLPHPDGTGLVLVQVGTGSSGNVWTWNGSSWSQQGDHTIPNAEFMVGVAVPDYGVCVFIVHPGGTGTPVARVYKP